MPPDPERPAPAKKLSGWLLVIPIFGLIAGSLGLFLTTKGPDLGRTSSPPRGVTLADQALLCLDPDPADWRSDTGFHREKIRTLLFVSRTCHRVIFETVGEEVTVLDPQGGGIDTQRMPVVLKGHVELYVDGQPKPVAVLTPGTTVSRFAARCGAYTFRATTASLLVVWASGREMQGSPNLSNRCGHIAELWK